MRMGGVGSPWEQQLRISSTWLNTYLTQVKSKMIEIGKQNFFIPDITTIFSLESILNHISNGKYFTVIVEIFKVCSYVSRLNCSC